MLFCFSGKLRVAILLLRIGGQAIQPENNRTKVRLGSKTTRTTKKINNKIRIMIALDVGFVHSNFIPKKLIFIFSFFGIVIFFAEVFKI